MDARTMIIFRNAVLNVLEQFAFVIAECVREAPKPAGARKFYSAGMRIKAGRSVSVFVAAPDTVCRQIAANALGVDASEARAAIMKDALKEFLNIVCGELAVGIFGAKAAVTHSLPAVSELSRAGWDKLRKSGDNLFFNAEGGPLVAAMKMDAGGKRSR